MDQNLIQIRGAKTHNLKNIDLDLPTNKIICFFGPSGSGKSSLAFHTLLAESKRRYLNSLPNDVKFFWAMPQAADVDTIHPVLPVWGLAQSNPVIGSRPNLGDLIGLSEPLQKLFFYFGEYICPVHKTPLVKNSREDKITALVDEFSSEDIAYLLIKSSDYKTLLPGSFPSRSFNVESGEIGSFNEEDELWELLRFKTQGWDRAKKKLKELPINEASLAISFNNGEPPLWIGLARGYSCKHGDFDLPRHIEMAQLSPYNAAGACDECSGHGMILFYDRNKLVKKPYLSINEGAINFLSYSKFSQFFPVLKKELKKKKVSLDKPFEEIATEKVWDWLFNGLGDYPGFERLFAYLESKRYKRNVRIYLRGIQSEKICPLCHGKRVGTFSDALSLPGEKFSLGDALTLSSIELSQKLTQIKSKIKDAKIKKHISRLLSILKTAEDLGVGHLSFMKKAKRLSTSEYQRCLLTKILSFEGSGSLFVLDEPSLDLTVDQQKKLLAVLKRVKEQGNTIVLIEHSEFFKAGSDFLVEMGPNAGELGGEVIKAAYSKKRATLPAIKAKTSRKPREVITFPAFKEEGVSLKAGYIPKGKISWVYGESIQEKKKFLYETVANSLYFSVHGSPLYQYDQINSKVKANFEIKDVLVFEPKLRKVSSRSTVGTTSGLSPELRKHFSKLEVSKNLGLDKGHFSPNSELGRCPTCEGRGYQLIEMNFLEDMRIACEDCKGMKLKPMYAQIHDGNKTAYDSFHSPMSEVLPRIKLTPKFQKIWEYMKLLNIDYLSLDREVATLSGGERQRLSLLSDIKSNTTDHLLIFENLTFGLGAHEMDNIMGYLKSLVSQGNTIVILDQNPSLAPYVDNHLLS